MRRLIHILLAFSPLVAGCSGDEPAAEPAGPAFAILPGEGITSDGGTVSIGATLAQVREALGEPSATRDLGPLGVRADYAELHLAAHLSEAGDGGVVTALFLFEGFDGITGDGVAPGAARDEVLATLGQGSADPFQQRLAWPEQGLALSFSGDVVTTVRLTPKAP